MAIRFFNYGPDSEGCGHYHKTLRGLAVCHKRDSNRCQSQGGHTDRQPFVVIDGKPMMIDDCAEYAKPYHLLLLGKRR